MPTVQASIDLGTNTCLLLVAEVDSKKKQITRVISDHSTIVRLGQEVDRTRTLHPVAMDRTLDCLRKYAEIVKREGVDPARVISVATATARDATNGKEFFDLVQKETKFKFRVLSGDEEAHYTFVGALPFGADLQKYAVIDIGGGSTEFMAAKSGKSLNIGSVRFTERFLLSNPVTDDEFWKCQEATDQELLAMKNWRQTLPTGIELIAVAGTATTLATWFLGLNRFDARAIDGTILKTGDLHRMVEELKWRSISERQKINGIEPERADVLLAGALILWRSLEVLKFDHCKVSTKGLRYGVLSALSAE